MDQKPDTERVDQDAEERIARLLQMAGPRSEIPHEAESRVYDKVLDEWDSATRQSMNTDVYKSVRSSWRRGRFYSLAVRWLLPIGAAAALAIVTINMQQPVKVAAPAVATVVKYTGGTAAYAVGQALSAGSTVSTGTGQGMSIRLAQNESLRLGENTELQLIDGSHFTLLQGRVYADTGQNVYHSDGLTIDAGFAVITDVGTQFAVSYDGKLVEVAVREGRVDLDRDTGEAMVVAGERLRVTELGPPSIESLPQHASYWRWASELAPGYVLNDRSLMEFLNWASRETGMPLVFTDNELRMAVMRTDIHGSVADFTPEQALHAVLSTTNFDYRIDAGSIYINK